MDREHILVVEDDVDINNLIAKKLQKHNYKVIQAFSGSEANLRLSRDKFHLVMLDLMLPGITGEELIKEIREKQDVPIMVISAKTSLEDKVNVLDLGADDYITKPFELEEIIARVNSQLRRYRKFGSMVNDSLEKQNEYKFKELVLNEQSRTVKVGDKNISLTNHEFDILCILIKNPDKVYSREALYEQVWKSGYYGEDNSVNVHVSNIRKKIKEVEKEEEYIKTVWGSREALYEQVWKSGYYGEDNSVNVHVSNIRKKIKEVEKEEEYIKTVWGIGFKLNYKKENKRSRKRRGIHKNSLGNRFQIK